MKILLMVFFLVLAPVSQAQYLLGKGKFLSKKGDGLSFVKEQLLFSAYRSIVDQQLKSSGYNAQKFWESLDKGFKEEFDKKREAILKRFGGDISKMDSSKRQRYLEKLRYSRLVSRKNYYKLRRVIKKWFISKRITRSSRNPLYRMMSIKAIVDRKELAGLYRKVTRVSASTSNYVLVVTPNLRLINVDWKESEEDSSESLYTRVGEKWIEWLKKRNWNFFEEMKVMSLESAQAYVNGFRNAEDSERKVLWLRFDISILEKDSDDFFSVKTLEYNGEYSLYDFQKRRFVQAGEIVERNRTYKVQSKAKFRSAIMNYSYRYGLGSLNKLTKSVSLSKLQDKEEFVRVENVSNINQVIQLIELMNQRGIRYQVNALLKQYRIGQSTLLLKYQGREEGLKKFLQGLRNQTLESGHMIKLDKSGKVIGLEKVEQS